MDRPIFREVALERLSSPDELDRLLKVTDSKAWIAQLATFGLIIVALVWGYIGQNGWGRLPNLECAAALNFTTSSSMP